MDLICLWLSLTFCVSGEAARNIVSFFHNINSISPQTARRPHYQSNGLKDGDYVQWVIPMLSQSNLQQSQLVLVPFCGQLKCYRSIGWSHINHHFNIIILITTAFTMLLVMHAISISKDSGLHAKLITCLFYQSTTDILFMVNYECFESCFICVPCCMNFLWPFFSF